MQVVGKVFVFRSPIRSLLFGALKRRAQRIRAAWLRPNGRRAVARVRAAARKSWTDIAMKRQADTAKAVARGRPGRGKPDRAPAGASEQSGENSTEDACADARA
ncbi:hypothetical protein GCM10010923_16980 [Blastomonas marina]|uniref:Uncharacterized protein n=1 Tax=Blastomonas marina TaxID=1867408 RepID=A0ABQ1FEA9_9SPHN|nr:hypothetical protein GCM10010923_16980 [Blastomonas marina]